MSDNWNDDQHPPWPIDDLAVKVANAYNFATGAWGGMSADAEFDRVEVEDIGDSAKGPPDMDTLKHFSDLAAMGLKGAGEYLIKGLLYLDTLCVMYGRSGEYKTFVALDWAFHIAAGLPWNGRKVKQGLVVYVATEGGGGFPKRIAALAAHYGLKECPFVVDIRSIDLASRDNDAQDLLAKIRQAEAHYGCPVRLIVIDTLARAMAGGDENSARDMGSLVKVAEQVQRATKAAFMFIHHQGKDQSKGARGSTALVRAIDTEIEISDGEIRVKKQRDVDEIRPIKFKFKQILLGKDEEGDNVTSGVIELVSASEFAKDDLKPTEALFVEAHNAVARRNAIAAGTPEDWPNAPVMREEWVAEYQKSVRKRGRTQGLSRSRISSLVQTVQASGHILKTTENQYVSL